MIGIPVTGITPDVSIADLIGDVDPIKAATLKRHIPTSGLFTLGSSARTDASFVINELP